MRLRKILIAHLVAVMAIGTSGAQAAGLIRDSETEHVLRDAAEPIFRAAGLNPARVEIHILQDDDPNAFVTGPYDMFVTTGLLTEFPQVQHIQAVIAHETGHIIGNHITKRRLMAQNASAAGLGGIALGVLVAAAGNPSAAAGVALGSQSAAERLYLSHTRAEEASADQTAVLLLRTANLPVQALHEVLEAFRGQNMLGTLHVDPYVQTHPLSETRQAYLRAYQDAPRAAPDAALQARYERARLKLEAFLLPPHKALEDTPSPEVAAIVDAIRDFRTGQIDTALTSLDRQTQAHPDDAYLWEVIGDIAYRTGRLGVAENAYLTATALRPDDALMLHSLGAVLVAQDQDIKTTEAIPILEKAYAMTPKSPIGLRALAIAYARHGQTGAAALVTSERFLLHGDLKQARRHAENAMRHLTEGSPGWIKASDILQQTKSAS